MITSAPRLSSAVPPGNRAAQYGGGAAWISARFWPTGRENSSASAATRRQPALLSQLATSTISLGISRRSSPRLWLRRLAGAEIPPGESEYPPLAVDCVLPLSSISEDRFRAIRALAPFGGGYTEPVFTSMGLKMHRCWQSGPEGRNLRIMLGDGRSRVSFLWSRQGSLLDTVQAKLPWPGPVDVAYTLDGYRRRDGSFEVMPRILTMRPAFSS